MIRRIDYEKDFDALVKLHKKMLGEKNNSSKDMYKWSTIHNTANNVGDILVFIKDEKLVASYGIMPIKLKLSNNTYTGAYTFKLVTEADYMRQGIFSKLNQEAINISKKEGLDIFLVVANEDSKKAYERLGWTLLFERKTLIKSIDMYNFYRKTNDEEESKKLNEKFKLENNIKIKEIEGYRKEFLTESEFGKIISSKNMENFFIKIQNNTTNQVTRSSSYIRHRYLERPDKQYNFIILKNLEDEVCALASLRMSKAGNYNFLLVSEFLALDEESIDALNQEITNYAILNNLLYIMLSKTNSNNAVQILLNNGFKINPPPKSRFVMGYSLNDKLDINNLTGEENWELSFGDADLELDMA